MTRRSLLTAAVAVLGLALSAALAWSASQLAGQRIGLASEPLSVQQGLAPHHPTAAAPTTGHDDHRKVTSRPRPNQTAPATRTQIFTTSSTTHAPVTTAAPPVTSSAPPAATTTTHSPSAGAGQLSSPGSGRQRDDHHPDD
jgi:hypothetical protein